MGERKKSMYVSGGWGLFPSLKSECGAEPSE